MPERVVKNKRVSKCLSCYRDITTDYKVKFKTDEREKRGRYYHLTCYYRIMKNNITNYKNELSGFYKSKRKLKKYTKYMILENLEK